MKQELAYPATFMPDDAGRTMVCFIDLPLTATDVKEEVGAMAEAVDYPLQRSPIA